MSNVKYINNEIKEIKPGELIDLPKPKDPKPRYMVSLEFQDTPAKYLVIINGDTGKVVPADDYALIKYGQWVEDSDPCSFLCSACNYRIMRYNNTPYCPNCGAKMNQEEREKYNAQKYWFISWEECRYK